MKHYGEFGGIYVPEILMQPIHDLISAWKKAKSDPSFKKTLKQILHNYAGRPTPLTETKKFSRAINGPRVFLKREDLLHTGAHKLNNALGQCLLAKKMGKKRIIAETGAGQHGVATAAACAHLGLDCTVYMGKKDMERQYPNVLRMQLMGAKIVPVDFASATLKEAVSAAMREWSSSYENTYYCLGSALGPYPYPEMVAHFQSVIGRETQQQCLQQTNHHPNIVIACVGGGSNAIGIFSSYLKNKKVQLIGVEAGGHGKKLGQHAARFLHPQKGILQGCLSYVLQDKEGQIATTASISAGLDYPSVAPQHAYLFNQKRALYVNVSDKEALHAMKLLSREEGIIPALESSHALAYLIKIAKKIPKHHIVIVNLSGRGDKDLGALYE